MPAHLLDWPVQKNNLKDLGGGGHYFMTGCQSCRQWEESAVKEAEKTNDDSRKSKLKNKYQQMHG